MTTDYSPLGKIDCFGQTRSHPQAPGNTDQFVIAEVKPSLRLLQTSLAMDDPSRLYGRTHGLLLLVADGQGERASGERASTVAIDAIHRYLIDSFDVRHDIRHDDDGEDRAAEMLDDLKHSLTNCRDRMMREVTASGRFSSMSAALTMAYVVWPQTYCVHVGTNRAYHVRNGNLRQMTSNSNPESLVRIPTSASLGTDRTCEPDAHIEDLEVGDALILCSDGVADTLDERHLAEIVQESQSAAEAVERILELQSPLHDDATVVVARFLDRQDPALAQQCQNEIQQVHQSPDVKHCKADPAVTELT